MKNTVEVKLGARSYQVVVGDRLLDRAADLIAPCLAVPAVIIVTDENVAPCHLTGLEKSLIESGIRVDVIEIPAGENSKTLEVAGTLVERALNIGIERNSCFVALGGGVIGDLTGFAASIALRGINFIQVPTTLLAQVDSAVGGKTGVNSRQGKNLIGTFYQPRLVLSDIGTLSTLPRRDLLAGYAEVVKYGAICDAGFFSWLEKNGNRLLDGDDTLMIEAVTRSCVIKAQITAEDEREAGKRALLNFGHTFAHALEIEAGFSDALRHGEAVAIGMVMAMELSRRLGYCGEDDVARLRDHLAAVGLPARAADIPTVAWDTGSLLSHMQKDKKVQDGKIRFILSQGIGEAFQTNEIPQDKVEACLDTALES